MFLSAMENCNLHLKKKLVSYRGLRDCTGELGRQPGVGKGVWGERLGCDRGGSEIHPSACSSWMAELLCLPGHTSFRGSPHPMTNL